MSDLGGEAASATTSQTLQHELKRNTGVKIESGIGIRIESVIGIEIQKMKKLFATDFVQIRTVIGGGIRIESGIEIENGSGVENECEERGLQRQPIEIVYVFKHKNINNHTEMANLWSAIRIAPTPGDWQRRYKLTIGIWELAPRSDEEQRPPSRTIGDTAARAGLAWRRLSSKLALSEVGAVERAHCTGLRVEIPKSHNK
ncbi:hypothetical protein EVAR_7380_1 [Eumeta japonica]|uniref:Uncharacterized protein n=1 Tax=Eumeta variegata TaxID=151549 RepID=A0A4C1V6R4_EUMVA|nr:hypothetical protein EVAR_7380_1 [Eumeta japonica]